MLPVLGGSADVADAAAVADSAGVADVVVSAVAAGVALG